MVRIAPSILAADYGDLAAEVARVAPGSDLLHVDVMDGHFVPNISIGPPVIKSLRKHTDLYFDCHLMIENPGDYLEVFKDVGANGCTVHFEVGRTDELIKQMRDLNLDVGLAVNPDTPLESYEEFLSKIDMLLVMTIQPGFGGQKFQEAVMPKLLASKEAIRNRKLEVKIEVDGGINLDTIGTATANGADTLVAGTAIFGADNPLEAAEQLRAAAEAMRSTNA